MNDVTADLHSAMSPSSDIKQKHKTLHAPHTVGTENITDLHSRNNLITSQNYLHLMLTVHLSDEFQEILIF